MNCPFSTRWSGNIPAAHQHTITVMVASKATDGAGTRPCAEEARGTNPLETKYSVGR